MNRTGYRHNYLESADGSYGHSVAVQLTQIVNSELGGRTAGSDAEHRAADWLAEEMKKIGLLEVKKEEFPCAKWQFNGSELKILKPERIERLIKPYAYASGGTSREGITAELLYLGKGTKQDYRGRKVEGAIVLIDIDLLNDWWLNAPTLEAELHGASAIINSCSGGYGQGNDDALIVHNFAGPVSIPSLSISRNDAKYLKGLLEAGPVAINLTVDNIVEPDGKSYNITGIIPGRRDEEYIIIGDHYDCHFWGFQDNNCAVGLTLAIAKAIIDSGYQPQRTLVFVLHGAEEWGAIDTPYDWCIGAWNQVFRLHPEWSGKALAYINFELPAYEFDRSTYISATPELHGLLDDFIAGVSTPVGCFQEGIRTKIFPLTTWSDDWSYSIAGIPAVVSGFVYNSKGDFNEFHNTIYHSQFDDPDTFNQDVFEFNLRFYGLLALELDQSPILELDFSRQAEGMRKSIDKKAFTTTGLDPKYFFQSIKKFEILASDKYIQLKELNSLYRGCRKLEKQTTAVTAISRLEEVALSVNRQTLATYKMFQDMLTKVGWGDIPIFGHEQLQKNILILIKSIERLKKGDIHSAVDKLLPEIENAHLSINFSNSVAHHFVEQTYPPGNKDNSFWGQGRNSGYIDLHDTLQSLLSKYGLGGDLTPEIEQLQETLGSQRKLLKDQISKEIEALRIVQSKLSEIDLCPIIQQVKDLLSI